MGRFTGRPWDFYPNVALGLAHGVAIGKRSGSEFACDAVLAMRCFGFRCGCAGFFVV